MMGMLLGKRSSWSFSPPSILLQTQTPRCGHALLSYFSRFSLFACVLHLPWNRQVGQLFLFARILITKYPDGGHEHQTFALPQVQGQGSETALFVFLIDGLFRFYSHKIICLCTSILFLLGLQPYLAIHINCHFQTRLLSEVLARSWDFNMR